MSFPATEAPTPNPSPPKSRLIVGPFNRVEGDLEVRLDIERQQVQRAYVSATMYRGFERMLIGKHPLDALVIVPRICGICSVSQSLACAQALAQVAGIEVTHNGRLAQQLMAATENIADHLTHFFVFFMPDFARAVYANQPWYDDLAHVFRAQSGRAQRQAIEARQHWLELIGWLGGKWPHTMAIQPGGTTRSINQAERLRLRHVIQEFQAYLEETVLGLSLASFSALPSLSACLQALARAQGQLGHLADIASTVPLARWGHSPALLMSYGAYPSSAGTDQAGEALLAPGVWHQGKHQALDLAGITEESSSAWLQGNTPSHPWQQVTEPVLEKQQAYSWCKAPRLWGHAVETGAFARQVIAGPGLCRTMYQDHGSSVLARVLARWLEIAQTLPAMLRWLESLEPGAPYCQAAPASFPDGQGVGLHEAARGSLGHWLQVRDGRIAHYQIIAPTTWNFSPRDHQGQAGPLEQALEGLPVQDGETDPIAVQHVVRSFDPCMVCTVH